MQDFEDWHLSQQNGEVWAWQGALPKRRPCLRYRIQNNLFISLSCYTFFVLSNGKVIPFLPFSWARDISYFCHVSEETTLSDVDALQTLPILVIGKLYFLFFKSVEKSRIAIITQQDTAMLFTVLLVMKSYITSYRNEITSFSPLIPFF